MRYMKFFSVFAAALAACSNERQSDDVSETGQPIGSETDSDMPIEDTMDPPAVDAIFTMRMSSEASEPVLVEPGDMVVIASWDISFDVRNEDREYQVGLMPLKFKFLIDGDNDPEFTAEDIAGRCQLTHPNKPLFYDLEYPSENFLFGPAGPIYVDSTVKDARMILSCRMRNDAPIGVGLAVRLRSGQIRLELPEGVESDLSQLDEANVDRHDMQYSVRIVSPTD